MAVELESSQYKLLSRYCEDLSKATVLSTVVGFFLPSVLPAAITPTPDKAIMGGVWSLALLGMAVALIKKGEQ